MLGSVAPHSEAERSGYLRKHKYHLYTTYGSSCQQKGLYSCEQGRLTLKVVARWRTYPRSTTGRPELDWIGTAVTARSIAQRYTREDIMIG